MVPATLQTIFTYIALFAGVLAAIAGYGAYHFGKIAEEEKDDAMSRRANALEQAQRPRSISPAQKAQFIEATKGGPFGPVILATRTAFPGNEQEDFTMQLRRMLDEAGFGNKGFDIVNGFSAGIDPGSFLLVISHGNEAPEYFSNLASGLYKIALLSPDVPVAINNPKAKPGLLYLFIPEK